MSVALDVKTELNPLNAVVFRKCGAVCASVAIKAAVAATTARVGQICRPRTTLVGNNQICFWSLPIFVARLRQRTCRPTSLGGAAAEASGTWPQMLSTLLKKATKTLRRSPGISDPPSTTSNEHDLATS